MVTDQKQLADTIGAAIKAARLPAHPAGARFDVTPRAVDLIEVTVHDAPAAWALKEVIVPGCVCGEETLGGCLHRGVLTEAVRDLGAALADVVADLRPDLAPGLHTIIILECDGPRLLTMNRP
ncbi:hypothetical protein AB0395_34805 [Streptosporangium sp. NPDC051023]|uniref:hypothetical protein n=1 Tax=Streptosporangium sp. NPDC051023 TaxID=3155410 RepID=UPI00344B4BB5